MPEKTKDAKSKETSVAKKASKIATAENENKVTTTAKTAKKVEKVAGKTATKKQATKTTRTNKKSTTKPTASKSKTKAITSKAKKEKIIEAEYYDLPYRYNETVVKVLYQTPTTLFIYWDISDEDRENFKKTYGDKFFEETKPVLIIHNDTLNYSFETDINDFANSWYLHVNDAKCNYRIELGRRPIFNNEHIPTDYIYISQSNEIESPNNRVLLNTKDMVFYRNVKTNVETKKSISFMHNASKIYNIYDLYKTMYKEEDLNNLSNPSS
jgi:hypothetical protein